MCRFMPACPLSSDCKLAHNEYEIKFFPSNYQKEMCIGKHRSKCLNGPMCPDAHTGNFVFTKHRFHPY